MNEGGLGPLFFRGFMRWSYIPPIFVFLIGVGLIITASVIKHKVNEGQKRIAGAQLQVDQVRGLTDFNDYTAEIGEMLTEPAQKKIDAGTDKVSYFHKLSNWLMALGVFLFLLGVLWAFYLWKRKAGGKL